MADPELDSYAGIVDEISKLKTSIERYLHSGADSVEGLSYADAIKRLSYLRNLQRSTSKKVRERYAEAKE
jgi:hypothetical protein